MASEQAMSLLKKKRGIIKGQLSKFTTFVDRFTDAGSVTELVARLEKAEALWSEFDKIQTEIELADDSEAQAGHRDAFEASYFVVIARARELGQTNPDVQPQTNHACNNSNQNVQLPTLKLPEFDGEYSKWMQFSDTFRAIIHNNATLTITQKFYYLRSCLSEDAARALDTLEASDANYDIAWNILKERFENKNIIIHNHVKALFDLPQVIKDSHASLRDLSDSMSQHLRALESLGQPVESWDSIIIFLITTKLDLASRNEWEKMSVKRKELPSIDSFKIFLNERCQILERLFKDTKQTDKRNSIKDSKNTTKAGSLTHLAANVAKCMFCKGSHSIYFCKDLLSLPVDKRLTQVRKLKLCTNCLRNNHFSKDCRASGCKKCSGKHNTLLHFGDSKVEHETNNQSSSNINKAIDNDKASISQESAITTHAVQAAHNSYILLATARIVIFDNNGRSHPCRALLDNGSQSNFITSKLAQKLGLAKTPIKIPICGVNQNITHISHRTEASIKSLYNNYKAKLSVLVVDNITQDLPNRFYNISALNIPEGLSLADPRFNYPEPVDILLGAGIFWELLCAGQIQLGEGRPFLQKTKLGWIVSGPMAPRYKESESLCHLNTIQDIRDSLERFWKIEECLSTPNLTREESECEDLFVKTMKRDEQGRFTVRLPFRANADKLGDSLDMAIKRLYSLEKRLAKDSSLKKQYVSFMNEYLELGHMTEVKSSDRDLESVYYLPHHSVVKESSITTKTRVVFDASAKTSTNLSLNDVLMVGPVIQDSLFAILIRFRMHKYVFTADVTKMYRQVNVHEAHRDFQRIIWRPDERERIRHYRLNTLTYGTAPASFEAIRSLRQTAVDKQSVFPDASNIILSDFYVDDLISGANTVKDALRLAHEIDTILRGGCFHLRKWNSNSEAFINAIQTEPGSNQIHLTQDTNSKTLGLSWDAKKDMLNYQTNAISNKSNRVTKRTILSVVSQLFDPLGLVSPTIVLGKIIMQKIWKLGIGWDEALPLDLFTLWSQFCEDMKFINEVSIPRYTMGHQCRVLELHGFSDASEIAYGACLYVRAVDMTGKIITKLLCAKSRVAPVKTISLPRLELCGAVLLARLHQQVIEALSLLPNWKSDSFYWCDSTIVLSWIATESSLLKTFVANRSAEIQRLTDSKRWAHVAGSENPADIVSRGMSLSKLATSQLWWNGPPWLGLGSNHWPITDNTCIPVPSELKESKIACITIKSDWDVFNRFSSYLKLLKVMAYCLRFIDNIRKGVSERRFGSLSVDELDKSLLTLVKIVQITHFAPEINSLERENAVRSSSKILSLNPFLDEYRILRVGGRLKNSKLQYEHKHPMLLPNKHVFTQMLITYEHEKQMHAGLTSTLAAIRTRFWILNARSTVRKIIFRCMICFRTAPKGESYQMGNLPESRVNADRPFTVVGIDYAGPFLVKDGKLLNRKLVKCYLCIFVCFSTRAVHLEVVGDLTSDSFLNSLKRFVSRRGICKHIYSDNATNFVGAKNELGEVLNLLNQIDRDSKFVNFLSQNLIQWHFIPPRAPNFGGLWEAAVKSAKYHIKRIVGEAHLTFEDLYTVITQIEAIMNSRPLMPMSNDPNDMDILTPGHFLIGEQLTSVPQSSVVELPTNRMNQYQRLQQMVQHFWSRWTSEYLSHLQQRSKWMKDVPSKIKVGSMVLLKEDNTPPLQWKLGRITELHPGADGVPRVISVKTFTGILKRTIGKICILPIEESM
ncbi:uncharacterized protein LOC105840305 [Monomorium pharaonis]|uniref:uncharacterized protein LOC105840305 n=1 Tax=Monomorium pharaonis TaxID=307658 RepID=UPI0017475D9D|nr:uncharacterized protein LOC105840305 [Monomorium pharaonis]